MNKRLFFLLLMLFCLLVTVQAQHLKFMGIPLTGTITQFQQKLATKGVTYDRKSSAMVEVGTRVFKGIFAGEEATIVVWYDSGTKIVNGAKAYYECYSTKSRDNKYDELKSMLEIKYADEISTTEQEDGLEKFKILVTDDTGQVMLGMISLYRRESTYSFGEYTVHVEYNDYKNSMKNQSNKMEDL